MSSFYTDQIGKSQINTSLQTEIKSKYTNIIITSEGDDTYINLNGNIIYKDGDILAKKI